ncbi:MAG: hypothetical protein ACI9JR_000639 [Gammaproteobacteria bacterium]|jgi:hypothetical protein
MKGKKISSTVITTVRHNIGDDFVREGILELIDTAFAESKNRADVSFELIHKHSPITNVYGFERIRSLRLSRIIDPIARTLKLPSRIDTADMLIQSGAPIYWCHPHGSHCADNEWFVPLIRKRFLKDRRERKFLNLAGGSCQRYHSDGTELKQCPKCSSYIADFFDSCDLTVLRDELAQKMLAMTGRDAAVLPCTSIFARDHLKIEPAAGEYIVLNFMENGGHFTFGQTIDTEKWRCNFRSLAATVSKMGKVVVACHNERELSLAKEVTPDVEAFLVPDDHVEFMRFYSRARFGIVNRVHSAFMLSSFGKPAAVIGADSRALMIGNMRLPSYFVEEVEDIDQIVGQVAEQEHSYREVSEEIRRSARRDYIDLISKVI